jgi:hypothetical protein
LLGLRADTDRLSGLLCLGANIDRFSSLVDLLILGLG